MTELPCLSPKYETTELPCLLPQYELTELPSRISHVVQHEMPEQNLEPLSQSDYILPYKLIGCRPVSGLYATSSDDHPQRLAAAETALAHKGKRMSRVSVSKDACSARSSISHRSAFDSPDPLCGEFCEAVRRHVDEPKSATSAYEDSLVDSAKPSIFQELAFNSPFTHLSEQQNVGELRNLFRVVDLEWRQRLASTPDLALVYSRWNTDMLFQLGLNTLKRWYQGTIPNSFEPVFALMHLAWAFAYPQHSNDESYCRNAFFQDMGQWQHTLSDQRDKLLFAALIRKLSHHQGLSKGSSAITRLTDTSSRSSLLQLLGNGPIIQECSLYLKGNLA